MMELFRNRYRVSSTRATWWNYRAAGWYFITICTKPRRPFFGQIEDGRMILNEVGSLAAAEWERSFYLRPDMNLAMGQYVTMPDHFHAIIGIGPNIFNTKESEPMPCVPDADLTQNANPYHPNQFGPQSKNLSAIVRGFKASVTRGARAIRPDFAWQAGYHEHIIRNEADYRRVEGYIIRNPSK